jgi:YHS domain-containing protein
MPSLPLAKKVKINQQTDYEHHNLLAGAFNEKILSGLGDCSWRIFYYAFSMFRGLRNPQDSNYPAQDEWFKFYANLEPKMTYGKFGWPEAQAGEAQGANVANPFMAWIFGRASRVTQANGTKDDTKDGVHGYWSEPIRLSGLELALPKNMPSKISGDPNLNIVWSDSEIQRGCLAFEPNFKYLNKGGALGTKTLELASLGICSAARRHLKYVTEAVSTGRYAPSYVPDQEGKGGVFRKKNASKDQIEQAIFYYLSFFRGTEDQRARHTIKGKNVITHGFDFEKFFSKQFLLAPNYSRPKYELNPNGSIKLDNLGNKKIKYDSFGYPELFPEGPGSFIWTIGYNSATLNTATNAYSVKTDSSDAFLFKGQDNGKELKSFNTNPPDSNNRFCLSAIFIQTSDIACTYTDSDNFLLSGLYIDVYVNGEIYESIPITQNDRYLISNRTGVVNDVSLNSTNQYRVYQFNKIHYFVYPVKGQVSFRVRGSEGVTEPTFNNFGTLQLGKKIVTPTVTQQSFSITIQFAHVLEMKPSAADAYVMMRVATTEGAGTDAGQMDPVGHFNADTAKTVFTNYSRYGVAYNFRSKTLYQNDAYVSANPVYESARKFISGNVRMADRTALVDYEIDADGNSVLYFNRYALGMKNTGVDIFRNMGPSITEVGNRSIRGAKPETFIPITKGKWYIVVELDTPRRGSSYITYVDNNKKKILKHGSTFRGGDYYFVSEYSTGTIGVYELDGITPESLISAIEKQEIVIDGVKQKVSGNISNEWTMFMTYNLYHWSNSSYWKPSMYGDVMGALNARCLTASQSLEPMRGTSRNVKQALANVSWRPNDLPLIVEAPSGYNYIESANTKPQYGDWRGNLDYPSNFAASCPIYKPPYKIKSIVRVNPYDPRSDVIKVIIENRLQNTGKSVDPSLGLGKLSDVPKGRLSNKLQDFIKFAESNVDLYRTDENALINYLCHTMAGIQCPRGIAGDVSMDNGGFWQKQRPFGCCYPRFYFVKLIPKVSKNTVMYSDHYMQMEYYLRAMCNGFINKGSEMEPGQVQAIIQAGLSGITIPGGYDSAVGDYLFEDLMRNSYDNGSDQASPISPNMVGRQ